MNPDSTPQANTPPQAASPQPSSSWRSRLKNLNTPQKLLVALAALFALLLLSLAAYQLFREQAPTPTPQLTAPAQASVSITEAGFIPATITVKVGTQLTWTNNDTVSHQPAADPHPLNNSIEGFESNTTLLPDDSLSFTFEKAGTYTYHDHLNPLDKKYFGTVVVE